MREYYIDNQYRKVPIDLQVNFSYHADKWYQIYPISSP